MAQIQEPAREPAAKPVRKPARKPGFLPIETNAFDRGFIGVVCFVALHLLWMRFLEASIPLYVCTVLSILLGVFIVARG